MWVFVSCTTACFDGHMGVQREGFCLSPKMCPKRFIFFKKEREKWMTHHILVFVGTNEGSSFEVTWERVCNSQTEACVSWCLTVQTQVRTTKMKREQNISKRHIKRESSSSWCLWTHSKLEKQNKNPIIITGVAWIQLTNMFLNGGSPVTTCKCSCTLPVGLTWIQCLQTTFWKALSLCTLCRISFNISWGQYLAFCFTVNNASRYQTIF